VVHRSSKPRRSHREYVEPFRDIGSQAPLISQSQCTRATASSGGDARLGELGARFVDRLLTESEVQRDRAIRLEQMIRRDVVRIIALLTREHPHVLMREHQLEVELRCEPRNGSAAQPSRNIILPLSRPQPSMIVIDRCSTGKPISASCQEI
jgi:hypothetical protein